METPQTTTAIPTIKPLGKLYTNTRKTAWLDLDRDEPIYHSAAGKDTPTYTIKYIAMDNKSKSIEAAIHCRLQQNQKLFTVNRKYYAVPLETTEFVADGIHFKQCKSLPEVYATKCQRIFVYRSLCTSYTYKEANFHFNFGYKRYWLFGRVFFAHRLIMDAFHPTFALTTPHTEASIDHIDCNRANNDLSNLQVITQKENLRLRDERRAAIKSSLDICETIETANDIVWD